MIYRLDKFHHYLCMSTCIIFLLGYVGVNCTSICDMWSPCKNGGSCSVSLSSAAGYTCQCRPGFSGRYCEKSLSSPCPSTWWGKPICGPCNCPKYKGFDPSCNKTSGECNCKVSLLVTFTNILFLQKPVYSYRKSTGLVLIWL